MTGGENIDERAFTKPGVLGVSLLCMTCVQEWVRREATLNGDRSLDVGLPGKAATRENKRD
jgi:hypothetical protein